MEGKILIVYHNIGYPMPMTNRDMLYCFRDYSGHLVYYVNVAFGIPEYFKNIKFDLIVFHDLLLSKRSSPERFNKIFEKCRSLKDASGYKIAIVQDEFIQTNLLNKFLINFDINHIFSAADSGEWNKIYPDIDKSRVGFDTFLTGYINEKSLPTIEKLSKEIPQRTIDIGYRASYLKRYSLGSHGLLKGKIAEEFIGHAKDYDLRMDISINPRDFIVGLDWYKFLLKSKYFLGTESGSSILDADGKIQRCVEEYLMRHPRATFEETEKVCFRGLDGNLRLFAIGPRHFEACMTKTCQILVEGEYNGILKPWLHYIPVKKDFSNVDEVLKIVKEDKLRHEIVEKAYKDIVESGKYTYGAFVENAFTKALGRNHQWLDISTNDLMVYNKNLKRERLIWRYVRIESFIAPIIIKLLPKKIYKMIRSIIRQ